MSQFFVEPPGGSPSIPTSFLTDVFITGTTESPNGTVIPAGNVVTIVGGATLANGSTTTDNPFGIQTAADPNNSSNLIIELTNRFSIKSSVPALSTATILTFDLGATTSAYRFDLDIIFINASGTTCGYEVQSTFKTNGAVATVVEDIFIDSDEDDHSCNVIMQASANNAIIQFTNGTAQTMNFTLVGEYIKVEA